MPAAQNRRETMVKPKEKARIAICGCGRIAQQGHLPYLTRNPHAEVVAAMDVNEKNLSKVRSAFRVPSGYTTPEDMFEKEKIDGVLLCTPNWAHRDLTVMAAERGTHVFCEKPMAVNAEQAQEMVDACERAGVMLQMGMVKRFDRGLVTARKMALRGRLGKVTQINTWCVNPPPPPMDTGMFKIIKDWGSALGVDIEEKMGMWRMLDERTGGGQLLEMGTHLLDMVFYFADELPEKFSGFINHNRDDMRWEDQGSLMVRFPSGVIGTAEMNMHTTADNLIGEKGMLYGSRASLKFNMINGMWYGLPFYHHISTQLTLYGPLSPLTGFGLPVPVAAGRRRYMHKLQMDYFVDKILGRDTDYFGLGPDFAAAGEHGLATMKVIDAAYQGS